MLPKPSSNQGALFLYFSLFLYNVIEAYLLEFKCANYLLLFLLLVFFQNLWRICHPHFFIFKPFEHLAFNLLIFLIWVLLILIQQLVLVTKIIYVGSHGHKKKFLIDIRLWCKARTVFKLILLSLLEFRVCLFKIKTLELLFLHTLYQFIFNKFT